MPGVFDRVEDMSRALIVVDVQKDFCEGGSLPVTGGAAVAAAVTRLIGQDGGRWKHVVATRDWHIDPGPHFSTEPDFRESWPAHCVVGTSGSDFHPDFDSSLAEAVFDKGAYEAAYSGFEGYSGEKSLAQWLREHDVTAVDVVGIATDHCVRATAIDAAVEGFETTVLAEYTAGVDPDTTAKAVEAMRQAGVTVNAGG
jgi:nicotinamidase/pyrazinamidase